MRIVLDTCIFVSALITKNTPPDMLYQSWRKKEFNLITSDAQLDEIKRVFSYKKLEKFVNPYEAKTLIENLYRRAILQTNLPIITLSSDPDDNKIIATALIGEADYLVSGDKADLLVLKKAQNVPIVTARQMVNILDLKRTANT
ncbi:MAG: putative toxin-antitoxin system toxin component, PIN family [Pseudomonadota bacterium]